MLAPILELFLGPLIHLPSLLLHLLQQTQPTNQPLSLTPPNALTHSFLTTAIPTVILSVCVAIVSKRVKGTVDVVFGLLWSVLSVFWFWEQRMVVVVRSWIFVVVAVFFGVHALVRGAMQLIYHNEDPHNKTLSFSQRVWVFVRNAFVLCASAAPLAFGHARRVEMGFFEYIAIFLFTIGEYFIFVSDSQLQEFLNEPKNHDKLCATGVRGLCRHPSLFGHVLALLSFHVFALGAGVLDRGIVSGLCVGAVCVWLCGWVVAERDAVLRAKFVLYRRYENVVPALLPFS